MTTKTGLFSQCSSLWCVFKGGQSRPPKVLYLVWSANQAVLNKHEVFFVRVSWRSFFSGGASQTIRGSEEHKIIKPTPSGASALIPSVLLDFWVLCCCRVSRAAAAVRPLWVCMAPRSCPPPAGCGSASARSWCDAAPSGCTVFPPPDEGSRTRWGPTGILGAPGGSGFGRCEWSGRRNESPRRGTASQGLWLGKQSPSDNTVSDVLSDLWLADTRHSVVPVWAEGDGSCRCPLAHGVAGWACEVAEGESGVEASHVLEATVIGRCLGEAGWWWWW